MKKQCSIAIITLAILVVGILASCTSGDEDTRNVPKEVKDMLSPDQQKSLEDNGMTINEGANPPIIEGVYYNGSNYCIFDSTARYTNTYFSPYFWRFYDQVGTNIKVDYTAEAAEDTATGVGSFITGEGDLFSVFLEFSGISDGVSYTAVTVVSGRRVSGGIELFMDGFILTSKDTTADPDDSILAPVGMIRIFFENDGIAESATWPTGLGVQDISSFFSRMNVAGSQ
jgi:hypothetical protein